MCLEIQDSIGYTVAMTQLEWDARLTQRGALLQTATPVPQTLYWRLVTAQWRNAQEAQGLHHILVDLLHLDGRRAVNVPVRFGWPDGFIVSNTEAKPGEDRAVDFPMFAVAPAYHVEVADNRPSDRVSGLGLGSLEAPHNAIHTSYHFVYQLTIAGEDDNGTLPPPPDPIDVDAILRDLAMARAALDRAESALRELST